MLLIVPFPKFPLSVLESCTALGYSRNEGKNRPFFSIRDLHLGGVHCFLNEGILFKMQH